MNYLDMNLEEIFNRCKVPEDEMKACLKHLEIDMVEDLASFDIAEAWRDAGITSTGAVYKLAKIAKDIANELNSGQEQSGVSAMSSQTAAPAPKVQAINIDDLLGDLANKLQDDDAMMAALRQQGVLQFDQLTYLAAIRALVATKYGVYNGIMNLQQLLLDFAVKNLRPAPIEYYKLKALEIRRQMGHVFAIIKIPEFTYSDLPVYATNKEARILIGKIDSIMIPALVEAKDEVLKWYDLLSRQSQDTFFVNHNMGRQTGIASLQAYPKVDGMLEAGKKLRVAINAALAGDEMPHAIALFREYKDFIKILDNPELPSHVGAVDRDNVLKMLGFDAKAALLRSEGCLAKFMVCMIQVEELSKQDESVFFQLMHNLIQQIDWEAVLSVSQTCASQVEDRTYEQCVSNQDQQARLATSSVAIVEDSTARYPGITHLDHSPVNLPANDK